MMIISKVILKEEDLSHRSEGEEEEVDIYF